MVQTDLSTPNADDEIVAAPVNGIDGISVAILVCAAGFYLWAVLSAQPLQSANDRSRWCTIYSLVEHGTYHIDQIDQNPRWSTIDKVRHRAAAADQPWHFYSSKPPLFPTMVAGLYWLELKTLGFGLLEHTALVTRLLLVIINVIPMLLALWVFRRSLNQLQVSLSAARWLLLTAAFASMLNPFLTTLNNHTPAAICLVLTLAAMIRIRNSAEPAAVDFAQVGFMAALTCCFELPAALFGLISFAWVVLHDWRKTAKFYVPAALIPLGAFFLTNVIVTGGIKPFYTFYGTEKYVYVHEGIPSYWSSPQGIDANSESTVTYLFHCVLGHHGILSLTPIFLLTLIGWALGLRSRTTKAAAPLYVVGAVLSLVVLGFYLSRTQNYNYGGNSASLRWMLWLTPLWWYGMIPVLEKLTNSSLGKLLVGLLLLGSMYSPLASIHEPWRPNWLYDQMEQRGWIDYRTKIPPFDPSRFAVIHGRPHQAQVSNTFVGAETAAGQSLTIETLPWIRVEGTPVCPWQVTVSNASGISELILLPHPVALPSERDPSVSLKLLSPEDVRVDADVTWNDLPPPPDWIVQRLRGLPSSRKYQSASPRYLQYTPAGANEKTAVKCDRGASRVAFEHPDHGKCWQRCDVFYCDEVPFGVARWIITVTKDGSGEVLWRETWTLRELP